MYFSPLYWVFLIISVEDNSNLALAPWLFIKYFRCRGEVMEASPAQFSFWFLQSEGLKAFLEGKKELREEQCWLGSIADAADKQKVSVR